MYSVPVYVVVYRALELSVCTVQWLLNLLRLRLEARLKDSTEHEWQNLELAAGSEAGAIRADSSGGGERC